MTDPTLNNGEEIADYEHGMGLPGDSGIGDDPDSPGDSGSAGSGEGDFWAAVDAGVFGDFEDIGRVPDLDAEDDISIALDTDQESRLAQVAGISNARERRRRGGKETIRRFDEYDFEEGAERNAFILIRDRMRATFTKGSKPKEVVEAIEWIFCGNTDPIPFDMCSEALGARPIVLRKRLMYEFYRKWIVFPNSFPFLATPLPDDVGSVIFYEAGDNAVALAVLIWYWPGVSTEDLLSLAAEKGLRVTQHDIDRLEATGMVACNYENWYVTCRRQRQERNGIDTNWKRSAIYA
nr:hypothetical protein [Thiobacillus denitrificans]